MISLKDNHIEFSRKKTPIKRIIYMGSQVSLTAMSVRAGRGGDEVLVSQAVWDYLSAAGQPWLAEFQSGHGLSAGVVRRTEMGGCCTVKLRSPGGEGLGSGPAPVSPAARRAFMDLCRSARKEMNRKEGAPKRKRSLMPCLGGGEADSEGSLLPPQPRRSQRQQLRCRKAADLGGGLCAPAPPPRDLLPRREAELGGAGGGAGGGALPAEVEDGGVCSICMGEMVERTTLDRCGHAFCRTCLDRAFQVKRACPVCRLVYGQLIGNQPANGTMMVERDPDLELPGHEGYGCIFIIYSFPPGTQSQEHLNPGVRYPGTDRVAYLPDSPEGNRVLGLLRRAFEQRLIFTIGTSMTTGMSNVITWNDIHHKTSVWGGPRCFGYPDPTYLVRVTEELREKGITAD